jgi:hypothetical protein
MTALSADRNTPQALGDIQSYPMLAAALAYAGGIAVLDASGWCKPAVTATGLICVGRFDERVDNSDGDNGDLSARVRAGTFRFANSADADEITQAEIGDNCYLVDDQTVAKTDGSSTRSKAGRIMQVDAQGVWVEMGVGVMNAGTSLAAANNLSDVGSKPTTRANLGVAEKMAAPGIVVGAEAAHVINVAIQLKDSAGADLAVRGSLLAYISDDANGDSVAATAPDTVAIGTDGLAIPLVAGKTFLLTSEADGDIDINVTNAAADTFYLVLVMPDGKRVVSGAITHAG